MAIPVSVRLADANQTVTLHIDEADIGDDARLCAAVVAQLSLFYPDIQHADIRPEVKEGATTVIVTKRAGTKGGATAVGAALRHLPEELSPAQTLAWALTDAERQGSLTLEVLMTHQSTIDQAITAAQTATEECRRSLRALRACPLQPAAVVLPGV